MNWLGIGARSLVFTLVGCALGFLAIAWWDAPWFVGLSAGLACAAGSRDESAMRGVLVAVLSVWTLALAQCCFAPVTERVAVTTELLRFHETLGAERAVGHAAAAVLGFLFGARSLRVQWKKLAGRAQ